MTRPDAAWNEERYTRYVKAAVFMAYAQNHGGGACIPDIIREFTLEYEVAPDLTRFGHQNLESFLNSKPDIFIKVGIGYGPNEKNLTEAERTQIGNMVSSFRNKRGKAKRGRRGGEGSRGRNPNFGNQTGFSVTAFDASESAFPRREVGNTERGGTSSFQYNQGNSADIRQNQNQNHGGFEESQNFAVSSNKFHANNQQFDQYNSSGQNYNDFEQFEYGDQKEEFDYEENQAADSEVEQLFHGVSLDTQVEHSAPPAPSPPPGFGTSSVKNSLGTGQPGKTTTATSAVRQKISVGMICRALAYQLWRRWPEAVEENHLLHLIEDDERFSVITRVSDAKKRQNIKNVTARFKKSIWEKFVFIEEKKDGTYYLFKATVSEEGGRNEQAKTLTLVIARLLKERGPTSIHYLASAINLEDNEGYAKEDLLDDLLRNHQLLPRIILLDDYTVPGPKAVLMPEATFSNWRPGFPNNIPVEHQKRIAARQIPEDVGNNQSGSVFDQRRASGYEARYEKNYQEQQYRQENQNGYQQQENWQETYSGQQEYRNEEIQVAAYLCQNSPLSTILDGNTGHYLINDKIRVFVAWAVDFNTFWVRTQDDDNEFKRLTDELSYVMEREARYSVCSDFISVGGLVAFAQYRQNEPPKYYRGRVLNKTRTSIRVECIDLGGLMTVDRYNVYRLPEKFRAAPNLGTRCSLGLFEVQRGWEVDFGREESQMMEFLTFQHADIRIINAVNGSLIVDLFYQDDQNDYVIPRRFLDSGVIRMR